MELSNITPYQALHHICGIYYYIPKIGKSWITLGKVTANARISTYSADVVLTQVFIPPVDNTAGAHIPEAKYSFPVYPCTTVTTFLAHIKVHGEITKTIRGVVKTKPKAKKEYEAAVARGETAGYLEQTTDDVLTLKLGNITQKEGTEVHVDVGYVTELRHDSEVDGVRFTVPVAIAPKYGNSPEGVTATAGAQVKDGLEMNVEVDMPGPVVGIQSPSHPIAVTIGSFGAASGKNPEFNSKQAYAQLTQTGATLDKDFVLQILCKEVATPRAILEVHENAKGGIDSAALMLTFVPKFTIPKSKGTKKVKKDIIFLVDRSGSMWDKIQPLKSALRAFLKSMPPNDGVRFDICSFGSSFDFLFNRNGAGSKQYSQSSLLTAQEFVDNINADYGGTEIFEPVKSICESVVKRNKEILERGEKGKAEPGDDVVWETEILMLTDGEVWDTKVMCDYVRGQTKDLRAEGKDEGGRAGIRIFTLGIGDDVSHELVEGLAKAGGGYSMTVGGNERFEGKVVRMLKAALGERTGGYKFSFDGMEKWSAPRVSEDDDFEMVDTPTTTTAGKVEEKAKAPISLFDPTSEEVDSLTTGTGRPLPTVVPPSLIQSPHIIPPLFPFNRTTVYLLLTPQAASPKLPLPETVTLSAVTADGTPLQLTIPVSRIKKPGSKSLHQLATKIYLDDLKDGEAWLHTAIKKGEKVDAVYANKPSEVQKVDVSDFDIDELVKAEGERIGVKWGVLGKWTAFVALEESPTGAKAVDGEEVKSEESTIEALEEETCVVTQIIAPPPPPPQYSVTAARGMVMQSQALSLNSSPRSMIASPMAISASPAAPPPPPQGRMAFHSAPAPPQMLYGAPKTSAQPKMKSRSLFSFGRSRAAAPVPAAPVPAAASESEGDEDNDSEDNGAMAERAVSAAVFEDFTPVHQNCESATLVAAVPPTQSLPPAVADSDITAAFIDSQEFEGYWALSASLLALFRSAKAAGLTVEKVKSSAAAAVVAAGVAGEEKEKVFVTALVVAWLEGVLNGEKEMWELVAEKAMDWLNAQLESEEAVEGVLGEAKKLLGIA